MFRVVAPVLRDVLDHDKKRAYLEAMTRGKYQPELLFSDSPEVAQRIASHPALLRKALNVYCTFGPITEIEIDRGRAAQPRLGVWAC
jgi:hypothetical protein